MSDSPERQEPEEAPRGMVPRADSSCPSHHWSKGWPDVVFGTMFDVFFLGRVYDWFAGKNTDHMKRIVIIIRTMLVSALVTFFVTHCLIDRPSGASETDSDAPKYCLIGTNGITDDHGVAQYINMLQVNHNSAGEPSGIQVMFTKFLVHTPVITSIDSNIYEVTSTRDDMAHMFNFSFQIWHMVPRKGPFLIRMEITN